LEILGLDMMHGTPVLDVKPYIPYDCIPSDLPLEMAPSDRFSTKLRVPTWIYKADIDLKPVVFSDGAAKAMQAIFDERGLGGAYCSIDETGGIRSGNDSTETSSEGVSKKVNSRHIEESTACCEGKRSREAEEGGEGEDGAATPATRRQVLVQSRTLSEAVDLISQVLRQDIRSTNRGGGRNGRKNNKEASRDRDEDEADEANGRDAGTCNDNVSAPYECYLDGLHVRFVCSEEEVLVTAVEMQQPRPLLALREEPGQSSE
jgi:hypothetical protein